jgi:hypothetical protein
MADMLKMSARQLRHPMMLFVPVKTNDRLFHQRLTSISAFRFRFGDG